MTLKARAIGRRRGARGRVEPGYPSTCREEAPTISAKRFFCRLQVYHEGEHVSSAGAWDTGNRGLRPRAKPPKERRDAR